MFPALGPPHGGRGVPDATPHPQLSWPSRSGLGLDTIEPRRLHCGTDETLAATETGLGSRLPLPSIRPVKKRDWSWGSMHIHDEQVATSL
jgi:hypothetical protein